jgi:predicted N-acetyltransferase YhbS
MPREPPTARRTVVLGRIAIDDVLRRLERDGVERSERFLFEFGDGGTRVGARDREQVLGASSVRRTRAGATPNPALVVTCYGMRFEPGPRHTVHERSSGSPRLPPRAAQLGRQASRLDPSHMVLREAVPADRTALLRVHELAFGQDEESLLVDELLSDPSARPVLSLVAEDQGKLIGHVLFTRLSLLGTEQPPTASILAPLAVIPSAQRSGVGRRLIERGCELLAERGVQLVFVLGDPRYYTKRGFTPASPHGLQAPYEIEPDAAWMVRALGNFALGSIHAQVRCADSLAPEKYWRE